MRNQNNIPGQNKVRSVDLLVIAVAYLASQGFFWAVGCKFDSSLIYFTMHLLDPELLRTRLLESVWYMHMQPPLFNLFTGWGLKLFPQAYAVFFSTIFLLLGLIMSSVMYYLARSLGVGRKLALGAIVLYVISPADMFFRNWYFYSYPVMAMLVFSAGILYFWLARGRRIWGVTFFGILAVLMLTRYSYHIIWYLTLTVVLFILLPERRRQIFRAALVPTLICVFWMGKNYFLFDSFTMSSWLGWSLSKVTTSFLTSAELDKLEAGRKVSPLARIWPGNRWEFYRDFLREKGELNHPVAALSQRVRSNPMGMSGQLRNFNNINYLIVSRQYMLDSFAVIRYRPQTYLRGIQRSALLYFLPTVLFPKDNSKGVFQDYHRVWAILGGSIGWPAGDDSDLYRNLAFSAPRVTWLALLFYILAPAVFIIDLVRGRGFSRMERARLITVGFMLFNLIYVSATGILLDYGENNRFRSEVVPISVVLAAVILQRLIYDGPDYDFGKKPREMT